MPAPLPTPPPLTNVDPSKIDEIRRTVYVGNLDTTVRMLIHVPVLSEWI